ncbi:hypothetical protein L2D01_04480 [Hyphomonadaceae bacterium ML37]|nr:hypothetical protein L2D01_04480 [Hyphomonadaceae bacterium ML37]
MRSFSEIDFVELEKRLYEECRRMLEDESLSKAVQFGLNPLYGPLKKNPDLALISFQGGGADRHVQTSAPSELLYLSDQYKFGTSLRAHMASAKLSSILQNSTVAHAAVFPQAPTSEASKWINPRDPDRKRWVEFSSHWNEVLLRAQSPKALIFFGEKASNAFGMQWKDIERNHGQGHMTFARATWNDIPAFFCHHLSISCPAAEAVRCFQRVGEALR